MDRDPVTARCYVNRALHRKQEASCIKGEQQLIEERHQTLVKAPAAGLDHHRDMRSDRAGVPLEAQGSIERRDRSSEHVLECCPSDLGARICRMFDFFDPEPAFQTSSSFARTTLTAESVSLSGSFIRVTPWA